MSTGALASPAGRAPGPWPVCSTVGVPAGTPAWSRWRPAALRALGGRWHARGERRL